MRNVILGLFVVVVAIGLYMIFSPSQGSPITGQATVADNQLIETELSEVEDALSEVEGEQISTQQEHSINVIQGGFEPREITVKKDLPVILHLTGVSIAEGFTDHGFSIREFGVSAKVPIGQTVTVEFTPDKTGSYVFFCNTFCGEGHVGQAGILHVID